MKKAYILMDLLISISLILIIATSLIPAISNTLISRQKLTRKAEVYQLARNQLELISSAAYMGQDNYEIVFDEDLDYSIDSLDLGENLKKYILVIKDQDLGEVKFEKILQVKSLYSN